MKTNTVNAMIIADEKNPSKENSRKPQSPAPRPIAPITIPIATNIHSIQSKPQKNDIKKIQISRPSTSNTEIVNNKSFIADEKIPSRSNASLKETNSSKFAELQATRKSHADSLRPVAPNIRPDGIPENKPLPPIDKPKNIRMVPPPLKPPPKRDISTRLEVIPISSPTAPSTIPPGGVKKGKKINLTESKDIKKRDKINAEFEDSDSDDEELKIDFESRAVKQPNSTNDDLTRLESLAKDHLKNYTFNIPIDNKSDDSSSDSEGDDDLSDNQKLIKSDEPIIKSNISTANITSFKSFNDSSIPSILKEITKPQLMIERSSVPDIKIGSSQYKPSTATNVESLNSKNKTIKVPSKPSIDKLSFSFESNSLSKFLPRGRLSLKCIDGIDIRRKGDTQYFYKNDVYCRFKLGATDRHSWKSTNVIHNANETPIFDSEVIVFDVLDVKDFILDNDLLLLIEVFHQNKRGEDECLGLISISAIRFFQQPYVTFDERVPLRYPNEEGFSGSKLHIEFTFEEARCGICVITIYEAFDLRLVDPLQKKQNPYVEISIGNEHKMKSKVVPNGMSSPFFNEEELIFWIDEKNWTQEINVKVLDEDYKSAKPIGTTNLSIIPYMHSNWHPDICKRDSFDLFYLEYIDSYDRSKMKEVSKGTLEMKIMFLPAGQLSIIVERATGLDLPPSYKAAMMNLNIDHIDPYAQLSLHGKAIEFIKCTPIEKDGGSDPKWNSKLSFEVVDQYMMTLEVFHQSSIGDDLLLGTAEISLLNVYRNGKIDSWVQLKQQHNSGIGSIDNGNVFLRMSFESLPGIPYPQYQDEVVGFDDSNRVIIAEESIDVLEDVDIKLPINTIPDVSDKKDEQIASIDITDNIAKKLASKDSKQSEFNDKEILAAFKFFDLNHNNFIGASEIRHILVCMGELITDEEIDMMIRMVDTDGDGQVSYEEFYTLIMHPNPDKADLHQEILHKQEVKKLQEKVVIEGKNLAGAIGGSNTSLIGTGSDIQSYQRQKELALRELKKKELIAFIDDYDVQFETIQDFYKNYSLLSLKKRIEGRISFNTFCEITSIEPLAQYKKLFSFFDIEDRNTIDCREFLLSCLNFIVVDREERVKFSFEMFDDKLKGFITFSNIEEILRGNHMISLASVHRKAETIMKQVNDKTVVTLNELMVICKKFPNILIPFLHSNSSKISSSQLLHQQSSSRFLEASK